MAGENNAGRSQTDGNTISDYILKSLDANKYATKKTIAQGLLDVALLTANASQLKYVLQVGEKHEFYILMLCLISISIVLQLIVAILFVIIGGLNINKHRDHAAAIILNDVILIFIFLITIVNIIISGFGIEYSNQPLRLIYEHVEPPLKT
ncbi:ninjurin-1 isoform X5 [Tenebrio molitor]|uniref:ninjurin-1 isoform X5 n=1 Tax=Tenebrio molitor TaxID=7067 RepID=UPI00362476E6